MTLNGRNIAAKIILSALVGALAACESSGGGDSGRAVVDASVPNFADALDEGLFIKLSTPGASLDSDEIDALDAAITPIAASLFEDEPLTPWDDVQTSGTTAYIGGIELVPDGNANDRVFGALTAVADFSTSRIAGIGGEFYNVSTGDQQDGTLALDAQFFRGSDLGSSFGISGSLTGILTGDAINGDVDIDISADFADDASVIYGGGTGRAGTADVDAALVLSSQ